MTHSHNTIRHYLSSSDPRPLPPRIESDGVYHGGVSVNVSLGVDSRDDGGPRSDPDGTTDRRSDCNVCDDERRRRLYAVCPRRTTVYDDRIISSSCDVDDLRQDQTIVTNENDEIIRPCSWGTMSASLN